MVSDAKAKFYLTPEHECSYFSGRRATTLFLDPRVDVNEKQFARLTENGFRRSGDYIYRPHCESCQACQSIRLPVKHFKATRSQKRIQRKNRDLQVAVKKPAFTREYYKLYYRYIHERHADGDMFPPSESQFRSFLLAPFPSARFIEFRQGSRLLAVSVIDLLPNALSAIYTFFEPEESERSLGSYAILWQIACCQFEQLPHLYLGYYIHDSSKMNYKTRFKPYQLYINNHWLDYND